ncbi:unnamed protein product [Rotaria socialis]|uniref:Monocarboxylate transporter n=2 Tax=Rotaria socialis TaxID=392032 RepID=A0A817YRL2_9BILA|nr:unnamed protein product [Rotaria socialis]CAF3355147.1 unnamed protein product [Rotaria socialis]CAF3385376.1 unnamed protein product [Rotaria socialis]CAF3414683.1 unnamed protein product [Rotaria socialis]CAF4584649.1 unnamed protein product [Rotaria socialis]
MASKQELDKKQLEEQVRLKKIADSHLEEEYEYVTEPPDGGFGWVIAIAAMLCNLVCDGTLFAFGTMKVYLQQHFGCSDMVILMVGSVPCGVYLLVGPIVSGLANRYGCRPIIIIGSIGAAACMVLSTFSPNVGAMIIIYGIFGGVFFGMVYLPSVVMVSFYFDKKRAIANGLVTAGTGLGALSFGPLANYLMKIYGWQAGIRIFAAIMLTCIGFGSIMRPLQPTKRLIKREPESEISDMKNSKDEKQKTVPSEAAGETNVPLLSAGNASPRINNSTAVSGSDIPPVATLGTSSSPTVGSLRVRSLSSSSRVSATSGGHLPHGVANPEDASRPFYKKDVLFTGSKSQLHHLSHTSLHNSNPYVASVTNIPALVDEEQKKDSAVKAFADILRTMTDFSILKNKQLLLICIGNIFSMLGYYLPIMCLVSYASEDHKVDLTKASFLLTIFGAFNTLGRFAGGPIAMIPHLSALRVHNALLFTAGVLTVLAAYTYNFTSCAVYAALCGFAIAPHMSLLPSVICDCVGLERYTTAFGVLFLFRGVTSIIGPPAAGFLKDYTKKYDLAFVIGGAMIIIASFFHMCIVCVKPDQEVDTVESKNNEEATQKNKLDV